MQRKNRLLCLIDFSEFTETTLRYAKSFSGCLQADIVLIHQLAPIIPARASESLREQVYKNEEEDTYERLAQLAGPLFDTLPQMVASEKELTDILSSMRTPAYFDWLFLGLKGTSFLEQVFIGSKAVEVLNQTDFVSVAIPLNKEVCYPKELVVAVDPEVTFDTTHLNEMLPQLPGGVSRITFLSITTHERSDADVQALLSNLAAAFAGYPTDTIIFNSGEEIKEIERFMGDKQDCFLVLQAGDPDTHDFIFNRGLVNELVYKSIVPMIVLPRKERRET